MLGMKDSFRFAAFASLVLILSRPALSTGQTAQMAQSQAEGAQQFAELGDFRLGNGSVIRDFRLGYRTLGKLNAERSNSILWPSWLGGKSEDLLPSVGPNKWVDSTR